MRQREGTWTAAQLDARHTAQETALHEAVQAPDDAMYSKK